MEAQLILLSGKQGAGKTTISNALIECLQFCQNVGFVRLKFADPIYEMHDHIWAKLQNEYGIERKLVKDRKLLQLLGTDWAHDVLGKDVWCKIAKRRWFDFVSAASQQPNVNRLYGICDDLRFPHELKAFEELSNMTVRLECAEEKRKARCDAWKNPEHKSETALDDIKDDEFDLVLNTGELNISDCVGKILTFIDGVRDQAMQKDNVIPLRPQQLAQEAPVC